MSRQYTAVFVDGPRKGEVHAMMDRFAKIKVPVMPKPPTAEMMSESASADFTFQTLTYVLVGHFAPCGRGRFVLGK